MLRKQNGRSAAAHAQRRDFERLVRRSFDVNGSLVFFNILSKSPSTWQHNIQHTYFPARAARARQTPSALLPPDFHLQARFPPQPPCRLRRNFYSTLPQQLSFQRISNVGKGPTDGDTMSESSPTGKHRLTSLPARHARSFTSTALSFRK